MSIFVYPCNITFYDIVQHFKHNNRIVWRKTSGIIEADTVFIYLSNPYRTIKYQCKVISDSVSMDLLNQNLYAVPKGKLASKCEYIQMEMVREFTDNEITLEQLKENGMGQFMVPMRAKDTLASFLSSKIEPEK